jgi:hypothetical protein
MTKNFSYDIIQVGTEDVSGIKDAITEIRFWHRITQDSDTKNRLYVAHIKYPAGETPLSLEEYVAKGKRVSRLAHLIERQFGPDQIQHMESLLEQDIGNHEAPKTYVNLG